jgi:predicted small metal-binding protein
LVWRRFLTEAPSKEETMLAIDCPCGHHFEAESEDELLRLCREHVDREHPEMERTDEQIRERVAADAYEAAAAS